MAASASGPPPLGSEMFERIYRGELVREGRAARVVVPWDVGQPQGPLMELEALGGIRGEVLDIGCGLGESSIFLATCGYSVTGLDGSPTAIERCRSRAAEVGVTVSFAVADATNLTGYDGRFDTVVDSALYHCLDDDGRRSYAAGLHRATRPGAHWHLFCFSEGNINGLVAPINAVPESNVRETLTSNGWRIDFLGPTTYLSNLRSFLDADLPGELGPEQLEQLRDVRNRITTISPLLRSDSVHLPMMAVHATRID